MKLGPQPDVTKPNLQAAEVPSNLVQSEEDPAIRATSLAACGPQLNRIRHHISS
jgi:hypothetical protein